jgi:phage-related baseplate assembly protein
MENSAARIEVRIAKKDLAYLKHIIESYENLATIKTLDPSEGIIEIYAPKGNRSELNDLLSNLKKEINFQILKSVEEI